MGSPIRSRFGSQVYLCSQKGELTFIVPLCSTTWFGICCRVSPVFLQNVDHVLILLWGVFRYFIILLILLHISYQWRYHIWLAAIHELSAKTGVGVSLMTKDHFPQKILHQIPTRAPISVPCVSASLACGWKYHVNNPPRRNPRFLNSSKASSHHCNQSLTIYTVLLFSIIHILSS